MSVAPPDRWRKQLNRAVRNFALSAAGVDDTALEVLVEALLRETGEAIEVDCCSLVALTESRHDGALTHYHWCRPGAFQDGCPFEAEAFQSLMADVKLEHHPILLQTSMDSDDEPPIIEASGYLRGTPIRSAVIVPTGVSNLPVWAWVLGDLRDNYAWPEMIIEHLQVLGDIVSGVLQRRKVEPEFSEPAIGPRPITTAKPRAVPGGKHTSGANLGFEEIIGQSRALRAALVRVEEVVHTDSTVLLLGETGTGKELFARALHAHGPRRAYPLVSVNCAALPPTLIESELFGHQRGAFTGAVALRQGRFELAHRGTLFLDEIGDLPMELQAKLLRVLQEGAFERVGSSQSQTVDVRIIAATHRDLAKVVAEGQFRADLYYRLNVFPIRLPALRERREDIPALVWTIIEKRQRTLHRHIATVPAEVMEALQRYPWPGNIRELENVVERALIHSPGDTLNLLEGSLESPDIEAEAGTTLMSVERAHIEEVLRDCRWRINGMGNAAERLGLHPNTLRFRMKKLGIVRHDPGGDPRRDAGRDSESRRRAT